MMDRVFLGIVKRVLSVEDLTLGRSAMAKNYKTRQFCGVIDVDTDKANVILKAIDENKEVIPRGIEITLCESLPEIVEDNSTRDSNRDGRRPSYNRDGRSGDRPAYSRSREGGDRPSYGDRPYGRDRESSSGSRGRSERSYR
jgi:hypothetical protein